MTTNLNSVYEISFNAYAEYLVNYPDPNDPSFFPKLAKSLSFFYGDVVYSLTVNQLADLGIQTEAVFNAYVPLEHEIEKYQKWVNWNEIYGDDPPVWLVCAWQTLLSQVKNANSNDKFFTLGLGVIAMLSAPESVLMCPSTLQKYLREEINIISETASAADYLSASFFLTSLISPKIFRNTNTILSRRARLN